MNLSATLKVADLATMAFLGISASQAQAPTEKPLAFEVASIRAHEYPPSRVVAGTGGSIRISGNRVTLLGSLTGFVMSAYNLREFQVSGAPAHWTDKLGRQQHYDISAKADGETLTMDQARRMLQTLLTDRFQLVVHRESKETPVFDLVVGKNGPKIKSHVGATPPIEPPQFSGPLIKYKFVDRPIHDLLGVLSGLDRPVLDKTGLTGSYDFTIELTSNLRDPDADLPVFTAVQEQLGLKLVEAKEPLDIVVIDSAEKPSAN